MPKINSEAHENNLSSLSYTDNGLDKARLKSIYLELINRIKQYNIKSISDFEGDVFLISNAYPGVWLEHVYDAIVWARLFPEYNEIAKNQIKLFIHHQREDGQLPCYILDSNNPSSVKYGRQIGYGQLQECVSFASIGLEVYEMTNDNAFLAELYEAAVKWDQWLSKYRLSKELNLLQLFCEHDTGHDNSQRLSDIPKNCVDEDAKLMPDDSVLPIYAADINAIFYGSRVALSKMAMHLNNNEATKYWSHGADQVKQALHKYCYSTQDSFFYDIGRDTQFRQYRSIHIATLFQEHVLDQDLADDIYKRHLRNPKSFWSPYPFPSMALDDPASIQDRSGNSWGFYSQGLTALRCLRWMDHYGYSADLDILMRAWLRGLSANQNYKFSQELHPINGQTSSSSQWYSSSMLVYIAAIHRLYPDMMGNKEHQNGE